MTNVAEPAERATVASVVLVERSRSVTVPVGVAPVPEVGTETVKVTASPNVGDAVEAASVAMAVAIPTVIEPLAVLPVNVAWLS